MILWGEEEQGSERSFRRKAETEPSGLCDDDGARGAAPCTERSDAKQPGLPIVRAVCLAERTYSRQESIEVRPYHGIIIWY